MSYKRKDVKDLTLTDDFMFGYIMKQEKYCRPVLELLLGIKIEKLEYTEIQKSIEPFYLSRGIRLDVYVRDSESVYDIEVQTSNKPNLSLRSRFYQSSIDMNNLARKQDYKSLPQSFILFICTFDPFCLDLPKYTFKNMCEEAANLSLDDKAYKIFYNINAYSKVEDKETRALFEYLKTKQATTRLTAALDEGVELTKEINTFKETYMLFDMHEYDVREEAKEEGRAEGLEAGRAEGLEEGRAEGLQEGRAEGLQAGRAEGLEEKAIEASKNLLAMGIPVDKISKAEGLSLEKVKELAKELGLKEAGDVYVV